MTLLSSIILGIVQGLTEFLPVSSSGHLVLARAFFNIGDVGESFMFFDLLLHFGTLIAVFIAFYDDIKELIIAFFQMIFDGFKVRNIPSRRFVVLILVSMIPMALAFPFMSKVEKMFSTPIPVAIALLYTSFILYFSDKIPSGNKTAKEAGFKDVLFVGAMQALAVVPGISRSGSTMTGGIFRGFNREFAVKFAFIMSLPVIFGANILNLPEAITQISASGLPLYIYIVGILTATISGIFAIKMVRYIVKNNQFKIFAIYCFVLAILTIFLNFYR